MAKGSGSTRASASNAPRGISSNNPAPSRLERQEEIAERFYRNGELTVDPGDAVYAAASDLRPDQITNSIENLTDYDAMPEVSRNGGISGVMILPKNYDRQDLINDYGADSFRIPLYENQSIMDIIQELRSSSLSSLFRKYR